MKDETDGVLLELIIFEKRETGKTTILDCIERLQLCDDNAKKNRPDMQTETTIYVGDKERKEFYFVTRRDGEFSGNGGIIPWKNEWSTHT